MTFTEDEIDLILQALDHLYQPISPGTLRDVEFVLALARSIRHKLTPPPAEVAGQVAEATKKPPG